MTFRCDLYFVLQLILEVSECTENWTRFPSLLNFYLETQARNFYNVVEAIFENLNYKELPPPIGYKHYNILMCIARGVYVTQFKKFLSESEALTIEYYVDKISFAYKKYYKGVKKLSQTYKLQVYVNPHFVAREVPLHIVDEIYQLITTL